MITETHTETAAAAQHAAQYQAARAGFPQPRVSVIIPTLNEARNLEHELVKALRRRRLPVTRDGGVLP